MKRVYEKPVLDVELFQLDAEVASSSCTESVGHNDMACIIKDWEGSYNIDGGCSVKLEGCYQALINVFFAS